ncbi:MAG TPA: molybdopterin-dependent oxidoreductase [Chryseolinea sp.]|nr:molybdopterin-dependent oxidoreductase [Chryseolinea sp.]
MKNVYFNVLALVTVWFAVMVVSSLKAQPSSAPLLVVEGEVQKPLKLDISELNNLKQTEVKAKDHGGVERLYKGVMLFDILSAAGVTLGGQLRGKNLLKFVAVKAVDGYEVIFSLPEIDPEFTAQTILLAYEVDGKPLPKREGPFRMVVPNDKKHARWIREITTISVAFSK